MLRLSNDIHQKVKKLGAGILKSTDADFDGIQAYSTYFHETIHWWQHIGSTSGFLLSLCQPMQLHSSVDQLKSILNDIGGKKSLRMFYEKNITVVNRDSIEFRELNIVLNNFHDIEYFSQIVVDPKSASMLANDTFFESIGHSFYIAYSLCIDLLKASFDKGNYFLPKNDDWREKFSSLSAQKYEGYYYGSPIKLPTIGLREIFEGQARFAQIQYLYFASGRKLTWGDFENKGMLTGVYGSCFELFLKKIKSNRPASIDDPLVALYMLVLDLSMNPMQGFPFDIFHYESFIETANPGIRFLMFCEAIADKHPELKSIITEYSVQEYLHVSTTLCEAIACIPPVGGAERIKKWAETQDSLNDLLEEESKHDYSNEDLPLRIIFSKFIRYQEDKLLNPEYFCWPGYYNAGIINEKNLELINKHKPLFIDQEDGDVYPAVLNGISESQAVITFNQFYDWIVVYELCRQWIIMDGEFDLGFFWLTSKFPVDEVKEWAGNIFSSVFNISPSDFEIIKT